MNSSVWRTSDSALNSWQRGPIRVLVATTGRHLFEGIHDDRIEVLFLLRLLRDGLFERGFVSFGSFRHPGRSDGEPRPTPEQLARALPAFSDMIAELAPMLDALDSRGRILFGMHRHNWKRLELWNAGLAADLEEYHQSWFSVVTETEMRPGPSRITEKSIKPLANFHPMLVLGNPGSLAMIRSYGFATFDDIFDESYDDEPDPRRRFDMVSRNWSGFLVSTRMRSWRSKDA